jgi:hypothetical protein
MVAQIVPLGHAAHGNAYAAEEDLDTGDAEDSSG